MAKDEDGRAGSMNEKEFDEYYLSVWKHYEDVAMHFNDLIIKLRTQSIGGLAALVAILGIFLHGQEGVNESISCHLGIIAIICLMLLWIAVWMLDMCYYNRLLEGAVNAILELEKNKADFMKKKDINLSSNIEDAFHKRFAHEVRGCRRCFDGRNGFYVMVFAALSVILVVSIVMYRRGYNEKGICTSGNGDIQNVCRDKK